MECGPPNIYSINLSLSVCLKKWTVASTGHLLNLPSEDGWSVNPNLEGLLCSKEEILSEVSISGGEAQASDAGSY